MSTYETQKFEQSGEIATIILNRPKLNLFNRQMVEPELMQILALGGETVEGVESFFEKRPAEFKT
ncbi:MAG: hypothetical protein JW950_01615 [Deltaproteobacteria bacterium]|nr:hypothetical protein [Deltaproteobacteria bacterium]